MKETIKAKNAPAAIGPYSHAVVAGNLMFLSGQIAINPETGEMPAGVQAQTAQAKLTSRQFSPKKVQRSTTW